MSKFHLIDRDIDFLLPPSVQEWLPEGHLARYVVEVVEGLDLSDLERAYAGRGSGLPPGIVAVAVDLRVRHRPLPSRKIERATGRPRWHFVTSPVIDIRPRHLWPISADASRVSSRRCFSRCPSRPREPDQPFWRRQPDGTKIHANASRHSALSHEHAGIIEAAEGGGPGTVGLWPSRPMAPTPPDGMRVPDELKRREDRLAAIAEAKTKIEARAAERFAREQADYQAKLAGARRRLLPVARSRAARAPSRQSLARAPKTRSTSPTKNRASCPYRRRLRSSVTTAKPWSIPKPCWSWCPR